ncbi:MAG: hypothetical protein HRU75_00450 [Planctomycetia bacterium]|nr:MAG: hypothetical protein HRU75_00450 [Planctomycetia bacterium]
MALTVNNGNTLNLLNILNRTSADQSQALTRLSTGSKINRGADDPAGLIALKSLETELTSVDAALTSNQRTDAILSVADNALGQVSGLLKEIQSLAQASANSAGLSADELAANQSQIDNAISSIDRIIRTTSFNGKRLLDGSQGVSVSGVNAANITDVKVYNRDAAATSTSLTVAVTSAAEQAQINNYATTSAASNTSVSISGKLGTAVINIEAGANLSAVAAQINDATAQTGVTAVASSTGLVLSSQAYGSGAFVRATVISGDTTNYTNAEDRGVDAGVSINGQAAAVDGLNVNYISGGTNVSFNLSSTFGTTAGGTTSFAIGNGGATFQLGTDSSTRVTVGLDGMFSAALGSAGTGYLTSLKSGGANSVLQNPSQAAAIATEAISQVAKVQGRVGGFQKFQVQTAINSLGATKKGLETARSVIGDVDYATETANLNRQNVLLQSAISLLGLANQQSSQVLSLLR